MHTFADASQRGYGAITYLRFEDIEGNIHCTFVMAKSRVAPLKETTIPRLELSAAVVATRRDTIVRKEIDIKIDTSLFWTDSTCVLSYLNNKNKRFQTFVANRIATINESSSSTQWRYVPSEQNPADDVSRVLLADNLLNGTRWINGPDFLWKPKDFWPIQPHAVPTISDHDPEVKPDIQAFSTVNSSQIVVDEILQRFSSWYGLKTWMLRYRHNLRKATSRDKKIRDASRSSKVLPITVDELRLAEKEILK